MKEKMTPEKKGKDWERKEERERGKKNMDPVNGGGWMEQRKKKCKSGGENV